MSCCRGSPCPLPGLSYTQQLLRPRRDPLGQKGFEGMGAPSGRTSKRCYAQQVAQVGSHSRHL